MIVEVGLPSMTIHIAILVCEREGEIGIGNSTQRKQGDHVQVHVSIGESCSHCKCV